jgi:hypothetical protein
VRLGRAVEHVHDALRTVRALSGRPRPVLEQARIIDALADPGCKNRTWRSDPAGQAAENEASGASIAVTHM